MPPLKKKKNNLKLKSYLFYVLNVKIREIDSTRDLTATEYADIFRNFTSEFIRASSSAQKECLILSSIPGTTQKSEALFFRGRVGEFTVINNKRWFDVSKRSSTDEFQIPEEIRANAHIAEYVFLPQVHRFAFRSTSKNYINPYSMQKFLVRALDNYFKKSFIVHVDVESSHAAIEEIYNAKMVTALEIKINYSNNSFGKEYQDFVDSDLKSSGADSFELKIKSKDGSSIDIKESQIIVGALESSISNGEASASTITGNNRKKVIKTSDSPFKLKIESTPDNLPNSLAEKLQNGPNDSNQA